MPATRGKKKKTLVVIPTDPIEAYEKAGYDWLDRYYNPLGFFDEVYAVSPLEKAPRSAWGMRIVPTTFFQYPWFIKKIRPAIIRAYGSYWAADLACGMRFPAVPVVVSAHDSDSGHFSPSILFASEVWCVSKIVAEKAHKVGVSKQRIRILPNRVDLSIFSPRVDVHALHGTLGIKQSGKLILHVGRKAHVKNLDTLILALKQLPLEYSALFIGQGDAEPYQLLAQNHGVAERCRWIPAIQNSELPFFYSLCTCMCTPSRNEGFGIVFIEAAACGAPIVTSNIAPMNEFLTHQQNAWLVDEYEDPGALANAIVTVCENPLLRQVLGKGARETAQHFSRENVDQLEVSYYESIMSSRDSAMNVGNCFRAWLFFLVTRIKARLSVMLHRST